MAMAMGVAGSMGSSSSSSTSWVGRRRKGWERRRQSVGVMVRCAAAGSLMDQYRTLRIEPGASEKEVKKAFRQLALQYHPDVCKGSNCGVQFHRINEAYDIVMSNLRQPMEEQDQWQSQEWTGEDYADEPMMGGQDWELWEEWMGWEGAGTRDYSSHINPYI